MLLNSIFLDLHSILRWVMLLLMIVVIVNSLIGWTQKRKYTKSDAQLSLFTMISADIQLLIGLILWFTGPYGLSAYTNSGFGEVMKSSVLRFFAMEHPLAMIIAIVLIHVGHTQGKKNISDEKKFKRQFWWYLAALIILIAMIPWPTNPIYAGRGWI